MNGGTLRNTTLNTPTINHGSIKNSTLTTPIVNLTVTLADNQYVGIVEDGTAGATLATWNAVKLDTTGKWITAQANIATNCPALGFVSTSAVTNSAITVLKYGQFRHDGGAVMVTGGLIYLSPATAGKITATLTTAVGEQVQLLGYAKSAKVRYVDINFVVVEV